jgi:hypothetical protein
VDLLLQKRQDKASAGQPLDNGKPWVCCYAFLLLYYRNLCVQIPLAFKLVSLFLICPPPPPLPPFSMQYLTSEEIETAFSKPKGRKRLADEVDVEQGPVGEGYVLNSKKK